MLGTMKKSEQPKRNYLKILVTLILATGCTQDHQDTNSLVNICNSHEELTIYYPNYKSIDLFCGNKSPKKDKNAIFCSAAAFTSKKLKEFKHSNIEGNHVSDGKFYTGDDCKYNTGAFVWYKGVWKFVGKDYDHELTKAAINEGMGFAQNMIILNGVVQPTWRHNKLKYRALCELDGKLCIIQSNKKTPYKDFVNHLNEAGVRHAIYLDMGLWREGWYRTDNLKLKHISIMHHKYYTNWLTFYK